MRPPGARQPVDRPQRTLGEAVRRRRLAHNPAKPSALPRPPAAERTIWTPEQAARFLRHCHHTDPLMADFVEVLIGTGMRKGEARRSDGWHPPALAAPAASATTPRPPKPASPPDEKDLLPHHHRYFTHRVPTPARDCDHNATTSLNNTEKAAPTFLLPSISHRSALLGVFHSSHRALTPPKKKAACHVLARNSPYKTRRISSRRTSHSCPAACGHDSPMQWRPPRTRLPTRPRRSTPARYGMNSNPRIGGHRERAARQPTWTADPHARPHPRCTARGCGPDHSQQDPCTHPAFVRSNYKRTTGTEPRSPSGFHPLVGCVHRHRATPRTCSPPP